MENLRDPIWQFFGVLLAVLSVFVTFFIYRLQRQKKGMSISMISTTSLFNVSETIKDKLVISMDGKSVPSLYLAIIRIMNKGNTPILSTDYELPIKITFENNTIVDASILKCEPQNIPAIIEHDDNSICIMPILLNPKEVIEIKSLLTQDANKMIVDGRIIGVKDIDLETETNEKKIERFADILVPNSYFGYLHFTILLAVISGLVYLTLRFINHRMDLIYLIFWVGFLTNTMVFFLWNIVTKSIVPRMHKKYKRQ